MSDEYGDYGRIHRTAYKGSIVTLFSLAMLTFMGRLTIRWIYQKRYFADDYVLLFGSISLVASFVLNIVTVEYMYIYMVLYLGKPDDILKLVASPGFATIILRYQQLAYAAEVLHWVTIFAVKFSYLLFFRQMVDRLKGILIYWRITMGVVAVSCAFCCCGIFIGCPHFGISSIECVQGSGFRQANATSWVVNAVDMFTDLLIVVVPIAVLRKVKIRLHQKVMLGSLLCLSLCMFIITVVQRAKGTTNGNFGRALDVQWFLFWHFIEASVAVVVVSLTAFRSLYSLKAKRVEAEKRRQPWLYSYRKLHSSRKKRPVDSFGGAISSEHRSLPHIPGATLTGMRSIIDGKSWIDVQPLQPRHETLYGGEPVTVYERYMP